MDQAMSEIELDASQLAVVEVPAAMRQIVIAGPGSGKTEVVSSLIENLVDEEDVDQSDGLLVISFSNVAVQTVDRRLRDRDIGVINIQTMDSLANDLLGDLATDDYEHLGFDRRIAMATKLLSDEGWDRVSDLDHLIVDEVQDVVGVRADFLLEIIECLDAEAGFTLLGDPAQGIYDFQLRPVGKSSATLSATTSSDLLDRAEELGGARVRHLDGQYRALTRDASKAANLRAAVLPDGDPFELDEFHDEIVPLGTLEDLVAVSANWAGSTALLTATNGQALLVASALRRLGQQVQVKRSAHQRVLARWIADLLGDVQTAGVSLRDFESLATTQGTSLDAKVLWRAARSVVGSRGTELDLNRLARRIRAPRPLGPELLDDPSPQFVVSTVHRAKGLEFDNVILIDFPRRPWLEDDPDAGEQMRTRFVALTRARSRIARVTGPDDRFVHRFERPGTDDGRWYRGGRQKWMTLSLEIRVDDLEPCAPLSDDARKHLTNSVHPGDPLSLGLNPERSTMTRPVYDVLHDGVVIARTTTDFGVDLAARTGTLERKRRSWPKLEGAQVESIATVVTDQPTTTPGEAFRLTPITTGLVDLVWKEPSE